MQLQVVLLRELEKHHIFICVKSSQPLRLAAMATLPHPPPSGVFTQRKRVDGEESGED